tara:strand:+ start:18 stop:335 length:318 start_codon:yes stop_codon:yes gene_type:complete
MANKNKSILLSDVKIKGNLTEKENIEIDSEIEGNINAENVEISERANIKGNIKSISAIVSGKVKGDINADKVHVSSSADVEGTISQKTLSIAEGATLKIKTETKK